MNLLSHSDLSINYSWKSIVQIRSVGKEAPARDSGFYCYCSRRQLSTEPQVRGTRHAPVQSVLDQPQSRDYAYIAIEGKNLWQVTRFDRAPH